MSMSSSPASLPKRPPPARCCPWSPQDWGNLLQARKAREDGECGGGKQSKGGGQAEEEELHEARSGERDATCSWEGGGREEGGSWEGGGGEEGGDSRDGIASTSGELLCWQSSLFTLLSWQKTFEVKQPILTGNELWRVIIKKVMLNFLDSKCSRWEPLLLGSFWHQSALFSLFWGSAFQNPQPYSIAGVQGNQCHLESVVNKTIWSIALTPGKERWKWCINWHFPNLSLFSAPTRPSL